MLRTNAKGIGLHWSVYCLRRDTEKLPFASPCGRVHSLTWPADVPADWRLRPKGLANDREMLGEAELRTAEIAGSLSW